MNQYDKYDRCVKQWNDIFSKDPLNVPNKKETGNETFDKGLAWLTQDTVTVLDFGCGSGTILLLCSQYGTREHIGIDLSPQAVNNAKARAQKAPSGKFHFFCGGTEALKNIQDHSADAAVLSNIIDNLYPEDAYTVLTEMKRILKKGGKLLVKLNPYLTAKEIGENGIREIGKNVLDDGMILWNNTTEEWNSILGSRFHIEHYEDIYYREYNQYNRMYLLVNR